MSLGREGPLHCERFLERSARGMPEVLRRRMLQGPVFHGASRQDGARVTLTTKERRVLRQAMAATATLHASNACSLTIRCVEAVVRWRQKLNVL